MIKEIKILLCCYNFLKNVGKKNVWLFGFYDCYLYSFILLLHFSIKIQLQNVIFNKP